MNKNVKIYYYISIHKDLYLILHLKYQAKHESAFTI